MKLSKELYLSDSVKTKKRKILRKIKSNKLQFSIMVLTIPLSDYGELEIYPSYVLLQKVYKDQDYIIVGLAKGINEAYELVGKIATDCLKSRNDMNIRAFLTERLVV